MKIAEEEAEKIAKNERYGVIVVEWIIYTILAVVILAAAVVCVCVFAKTRRDFSRNDVHINGGADIQTGRVSRDQNYFKGITGKLGGTVVVEGSRAKSRGFFIEIMNISNGDKADFNVNNELIIGRILGENVYALPNDLMVSKQHCRLFVSGSDLYLEDLGSANHTYLNGTIITEPTRIQSGDTICLGKTELGIVY